MADSFRAIITLLGPARPGHPDQGLPEEEVPADPDYGVEAPTNPDQGLPPGMFPPHKPILPRPPGKPPTIWPPSGNIDNTLPLPPADLLPPEIDNTLPPSVGHLPVWPSPGLPGTIWPPLPSQGLPEGHNVVVIVWVPGVGYRWVVIDPGLTVDNSLPGTMPQPK